MRTLFGTSNKTLVKAQSTGTGALAQTATAVRVSQVASVTLHLDSIPTTSEALTITLDAVAGAAYDVLLYSLDLAAVSAADLVWFPNEEIWLEPGDALTVAYANSDGATYGVQTTLMEMM